MPKYIVPKAVNSNKTLEEHNVFVLKKQVDAISTQYTKSTFLRDGSLLLLCNNSKVAERFIKTKQLGAVPVSIEYHDKLNACKGTVFSKTLVRHTNKEIVEGLQQYGITDVYKMTRIIEGTQQCTRLAILTFDRFAPPKEMEIGFGRLVEVREYIPNPMQCKNCQVLGHTKKHCKTSEEICETCAPAKPHDPCTRTACVNCAVTTHPSNSRECPKYLLQKEFLRIKTQRHCTLYEAKKLYYQINPGANSTKPTFTDILKNASHTDQNTPRSQNINPTQTNHTNRNQPQTYVSTTTPLCIDAYDINKQTNSQQPSTTNKTSTTFPSISTKKATTNDPPTIPTKTTTQKLKSQNNTETNEKLLSNASHSSKTTSKLALQTSTKNANIITNQNKQPQTTQDTQNNQKNDAKHPHLNITTTTPISNQKNQIQQTKNTPTHSNHPNPETPLTPNQHYENKQRKYTLATNAQLEDGHT